MRTNYLVVLSNHSSDSKSVEIVDFVFDIMFVITNLIFIVNDRTS